MRISDWSSDVCSSDLGDLVEPQGGVRPRADELAGVERAGLQRLEHVAPAQRLHRHAEPRAHFRREAGGAEAQPLQVVDRLDLVRSEEHTSELQSLMRLSYAVFCLKKTKHKKKH